ncbi:MAG: B12-binding domain-containing radical SAM protein [Elusimicrobia bacterium]|nr:B12-binding domain-containing radical SAM protein [Elusimicrobiota bacterium]
MKKNVVLIYPRLSIQSRTFLQTPFALVVIAPYLEKAGYEVRIIDIRTEPDYKDAIIDSIDDNTLFAGISSMTGSQLRSAIDASKFIKSRFDVPVVWGGIHATLMPLQVMENAYVDIVASGEGENNVVPLARALDRQIRLEDVPGLYYRDGSEIVNTGPADLFDMDKSLPPAWHLIDMSRYNNFGMQIGRGCPFPCEYCYNVVYNRQRWRTKPLPMIFEEITCLVEKYGVKTIFFYDDNFFTSRQRVEAICRFILEKKYDIRWYTTCRSDYFASYGPDFFKLMRASGCDTLAIGVESGSQRILDMLQKKETVEDSVCMARITRDTGIIPECGFMIGIPGETEEDRLKTYDFMDRLTSINRNAYITSLAIYTPYPGAPLIEKIKKEYGFRMPEKLEDWIDYNFHNCNFDWISRSQKRMLVAISYIPRFVFWKKKLRERYVNFWLLPFYYFMTWTAGLRWRHRYFGFPVEYVILNWFLKVRNRLS